MKYIKSGDKFIDENGTSHSSVQLNSMYNLTKIDASHWNSEELEFHLDDKMMLHREDGPAWISITGRLKREEYSWNGKHIFYKIGRLK